MIVPTSNLFNLTYGKYAIGAYNINNMEQTLGLFRGCIESQAPFIIQLSKGARKYADKGMLEVIIRKAEEIFPEAVFAVHLDHGDEATCYDCIESGFYSSVRAFGTKRCSCRHGRQNSSGNRMLAWTLRACANRPCCCWTQAGRSQRGSLACADRGNWPVTKVQLAEVNT